MEREPSVETTKRGDKVANVQALRAIAALLVLAMHAIVRQVTQYSAHDAYTLWAMRVAKSIGHFGVDVFFVISGFIIFTVAQRTGRRMDTARVRETAHFVWRRILRVYPLYWLTAGVMLAITSSLGHPTVGLPTSTLPSQLLLLTRTIDVQPVAWTLTFEMYFYGAVAVALLVGGRRAVLGIGGWVAAEAAVIAYWGLAPDANSILAPWSRSVALDPLVLEFGFGCLVAVALARRASLPAYPTLLVAAALIAAGARALYKRQDTLGAIIDPYQRLAFFGVGAAFLLYGAVVLEHRHGRVAPPWLQALGDASYSLYLWHIPVITIVAEVARRLAPGFLQAGLVMASIEAAIAILVARASYRYFERPILDRR